MQKLIAPRFALPAIVILALITLALIAFTMITKAYHGAALIPPGCC